ncbi:hypothetical protein [uncultured Gammaproteobacteria bacterium]|nr:hypothetical protein [uncultured Gammaproteobacteria bacterium]
MLEKLTSKVMGLTELPWLIVIRESLLSFVKVFCHSLKRLAAPFNAESMLSKK